MKWLDGWRVGTMALVLFALMIAALVVMALAGASRL
jgi:hypothetical protein